MATDPKKNIIDGRKRLLTIHDGARLTPALCRLLEGLSDEAGTLLGDKDRSNASTYDLERADPILVARADGLAVYVNRDGRLA